MFIRPKGIGVFYGRRSSDQQESSLEGQVSWAIRAAREEGIPLNANTEMVNRAMSEKIAGVGDLYIDDSISGSSCQRQGWAACVARLENDQEVSHLFVYKRDRIARPEDAAAATSSEFQLLSKGVTIVFVDSKALPSVDGRASIAHLISAVIEYNRGHEYVQDLSHRVIETKRLLALQGFSAGGRAPYGFGRFLKSPSGELTPVPDGRRIRQTGYHIVLLPNDDAKISIWLMILDMKDQGAGHKQIANFLNDSNIPSPDAGRTRTDGGGKHLVSGRWNPNTIGAMCRNPIIAGVLQHGVRSEGKHRRISPNGSRALEPGERTGDKVKRVINPVENRIQTEASFAPLISREVFDRIQEKIDARAKCQQGVPRAHDPGKYPLSTRVVDLTNGCGSLMYGVPHTKLVNKEKVIDPFYTCGRYLKTSECDHNKVNGERLLSVTLKALKHLVRRAGTRSELVLQLQRLVATKQPSESKDELRRKSLESQITNLTREIETIGRKIAVETNDDLIAIFRKTFTEKGAHLRDAKSQYASLSHAHKTTAAPTDQVEQALSLLDNLESLASSPEARPQINAVLRELGVWVGLDYKEAMWGKRPVRRLSHGIITFGGYHLPVPLHGRDNIDHPENSNVGGCSTACQPAASIPTSLPDDESGTDAGITAKVNEKVDSSTKGNRGDKI